MFRAKPADKRNTNTTIQGLVDTGLIFELRVLCCSWFELDGNFLSRNYVGAQVDISETATANLASDAVFVANTNILGG